eukprot:TRINITY_DN6511_c0_g2_i1.p1 TRINITY_DN6511_c0_g2~~TRINITY_DN6511_c0_g2_i1.p1  ORF type:complete len:413 (-),score=74.38 TRINITY_DN6511_c0_g2_i1:662-1834(-)
MATGQANDSWQQVWDEKYQRHYFFNFLTGESSWVQPEGYVAPQPAPVPRQLTVLVNTSARASPRTSISSPRTVSSPNPAQSPRRSISSLSSPKIVRKAVPDAPAPTFKPEISKHAKALQRPDAVAAMFHWKQEREQKLAKLRAEYQDNELREMRSPHITKRAEKTDIDIHQRMASWSERRQANLEQLRKQKDDEEVKELRKVPQISSLAKGIERVKDANDIWIAQRKHNLDALRKKLQAEEEAQHEHPSYVTPNSARLLQRSSSPASDRVEQRLYAYHKLYSAKREYASMQKRRAADEMSSPVREVRRSQSAGRLQSERPEWGGISIHERLYQQGRLAKQRLPLATASSFGSYAEPTFSPRVSQKSDELVRARVAEWFASAAAAGSTNQS